MTNQYYEINYCSGLVNKVFGNSFSTSSVTSEGDGYYLPARRVVSGFTKWYSMLSMEKHTTFDLSNYANVVESNGVIERASIPYNDYLPVSNSTIIWIKVSLISLVIAIFFNLSTLIGSLIRLLMYKWKKSERPRTGFDKYHIAINIAGMGFILNTILLYTRGFAYVSYASLRIHLILNLIYVILAVGYLVLLIYKLRKISCSKKRKAIYIMSGLSAFIFAATILGWELYF